MTNYSLPKLADVDSASWARLAGRRIFFGHQSVGQNIVDGIKEVLAANPQIRVSVVESKDPHTMRAAGLYHARVGRNEYPEDKVRDFEAVADGAFTSGAGIGMVKFCYVDVGADSDPQALFDAYQRRMEALSGRHPELTLVHITMPLKITENWRGRLMSWLRGRTTERDLNLIRNRYNDLLRQAYQHRAPVFDLATIESTRPGGSRAFFTRGADTVYILAGEYSADGSHLNESARRMAAEQLLILLARLPGS